MKFISSKTINSIITRTRCTVLINNNDHVHDRLISDLKRKPGILGESNNYYLGENSCWPLKIVSVAVLGTCPEYCIYYLKFQSNCKISRRRNKLG